MKYLLMTLMCLAVSTGQVLVKKGINRRKPYYLDWYIAAGALLVLFAPLIYLRVVKTEGLSGAFGLNGLSYLAVYFLGIAVLKEKGSLLQTVGVVFILGGIVIWSI